MMEAVVLAVVVAVLWLALSAWLIERHLRRMVRIAEEPARAVLHVGTSEKEAVDQIARPAEGTLSDAEAAAAFHDSLAEWEQHHPSPPVVPGPK